MDRTQRYQKEAQKRLRMKKQLSFVFFLLVGLPILALIKADIEGKDLSTYVSPEILWSWLALYAFFTLIFYKIWRCPRCEKSLIRLSERFPILRPACRHCGQMLFPEAQKKSKTSQAAQTIRPGFLGLVLFLGASALGFGFVFEDSTYQAIGGSILILCLIVKLALSRVKYCSHCGHGNAKGTYCEECGEKLKSS